MVKEITVGSVKIGGNRPLVLIAGPCVMESESDTLHCAERLMTIANGIDMPLIFKASYDKANRTSVTSFRGPGLTEGLRILARVKEALGVPVLSDIHSIEQVQPAATVLDVIQIPAFLCRQTDILVAAAKTGNAINIKKGQFVSPWDIRHAVTKVRESGNDRVFLTERGSSFGYNNLVVDMRSLAIMRDFAPVVFDATHSVQLPSAGANGEAVSGGQPEFIPVLSRAAVAAGVDGVFMEVHDDPPRAKSDGANALELQHLRGVLNELLAVHRAVTSSSK